MKASRTDFCVRVLALLAVVCMTHGLALAWPPPVECDNKCRERYTFIIDGAGGVECINYWYKDCGHCSNGLCAQNAADPLPDGKCEEDKTKTQEFRPASCNLICTLNAGSKAEAIMLEPDDEFG